MKKLTFLFAAIFAVFLFSRCGNEKKSGGNAMVSGKFENAAGDTLYLVDVSTRTFHAVDSMIVGDDGTFEFHPLIAYKGFYNIYVGHNSEMFVTMIMEAGDTIKVTGDAKNLGYTWSATGSVDTDRFKKFNDYISAEEKKRQPLMQESDSLLQTFQALVSMMPKKDSAKVDSLDKVYSPRFTEIQAKIAVLDSANDIFVRNFINEKPASFANIPALRLLEPFDNFEYYEKTVSALEEKYKNSPNVSSLRSMVEQERPFCKGQTPPEIALNDPNGVVYKLSSLKGKVVLLDFWASWCGPCRAELPNVVKNYKKYHDQGFEVFSVSLDANKTDWVNAINKEGLVWPYQVSDLQQWQSSVVPAYRIQSIPKTLLLDRDGKIIARDLRGDALGKKLEEVFGTTEADNAPPAKNK